MRRALKVILILTVVLASLAVIVSAVLTLMGIPALASVAGDHDVVEALGSYMVNVSYVSAAAGIFLAVPSVLLLVTAIVGLRGLKNTAFGPLMFLCGVNLILGLIIVVDSDVALIVSPLVIAALAVLVLAILVLAWRLGRGVGTPGQPEGSPNSLLP